MLLSAAVLCLPAHAIDVTDLRAEQLSFGAESIRKELALTPNQQTLWQQSAARAQALLRARHQRRERLQSDFKAALAVEGMDLRELSGRLDAESATSEAENRQLRELWLSVNDALTDGQRVQVTALLRSQLERVEGEPGRRPEGGDRREGERRPGGRGR